MRCIIRIPGSTPYGFRLAGGDGCAVTVARVRKESKANDAGLQEGDVVLAINDISCQGLSYNSVFGLTELNDHELKLEILRGANAESNWKTALTFLDNTVERLCEHDVFNLLKDKNKQTFDESNQQIFQLQSPKPKVKLTSVPRIDVISDPSDLSINLLTTVPKTQTFSQPTVHIIKPQQIEQRSLIMKTENRIEDGVPFVSRIFQSLHMNGNSGMDITLPEKPITFEIKASDCRPLHFESNIVEQNQDNQRQFSHQTLTLLGPHQRNANFTDGPDRYQMTASKIFTSNNKGGVFNNVDGAHRHFEENFTRQTWTTPKIQVEQFDQSQSKPYQTNFSGNASKAEISVNTPRFFNQFCERRDESVDNVPPSNTFKTFNVSENDLMQKDFKKYNFDPQGVNSSPLVSKPQNDWSNKSEQTFYEPYSLSCDFNTSPSKPTQMFTSYQGPSTQESSVSLAPPPPPFPAGGIPKQLTTSSSDTNLHLYSGSPGIKETEKDLMNEKVQMAKDMAHSVLSPANKNSAGQKMFLKRRANSENWTIEGPDPAEKRENQQFNAMSFKNPMRPLTNFPGKQMFNSTPKQLLQTSYQPVSNPVQQWSPFNPRGPSTIQLGYCDL